VAQHDPLAGRRGVGIAQRGGRDHQRRGGRGGRPLQEAAASESRMNHDGVSRRLQYALKRFRGGAGGDERRLLAPPRPQPRGVLRPAKGPRKGSQRSSAAAARRAMRFGETDCTSLHQAHPLQRVGFAGRQRSSGTPEHRASRRISSPPASVRGRACRRTSSLPRPSSRQPLCLRRPSSPWPSSLRPPSSRQPPSLRRPSCP
jgi:hypothetical protein